MSPLFQPEIVMHVNMFEVFRFLKDFINHTKFVDCLHVFLHVIIRLQGIKKLFFIVAFKGHNLLKFLLTFD